MELNKNVLVKSTRTTIWNVKSTPADLHKRIREFSKKRRKWRRMCSQPTQTHNDSVPSQDRSVVIATAKNSVGLRTDVHILCYAYMVLPQYCATHMNACVVLTASWSIIVCKLYMQLVHVLRMGREWKTSCTCFFSRMVPALEKSVASSWLIPFE